MNALYEFLFCKMLRYTFRWCTLLDVVEKMSQILIGKANSNIVQGFFVLSE